MNSCLLIGLRNMPRVFYSHTRFIFHKLKWCWVKKPESGRFDNFLHIYYSSFIFVFSKITLHSIKVYNLLLIILFSLDIILYD